MRQPGPSRQSPSMRSSADRTRLSATVVPRPTLPRHAIGEPQLGRDDRGLERRNAVRVGGNGNGHGGILRRSRAQRPDASPVTVRPPPACTYRPPPPPGRSPRGGSGGARRPACCDGRREPRRWWAWCGVRHLCRADDLGTAKRAASGFGSASPAACGDRRRHAVDGEVEVEERHQQHPRRATTTLAYKAHLVPPTWAELRAMAGG